MWPFTKKSMSKPALSKLVCKTNEAFFQLQCKYSDTFIEANNYFIAIVVDASAIYGTPTSVKIESDGVQTATLRVVSEDGGFIVIAKTNSGKGDRLKPGDLVLWLAGVYMENLGRAMSDRRSGWVGLIIQKIDREIDPNTCTLTTLCRY